MPDTTTALLYTLCAKKNVTSQDLVHHQLIIDRVIREIKNVGRFFGTQCICSL